MTHDTKITTAKCTKVRRTAAAERMRLHRERRSLGLRCLTIMVQETEIDALVREGFLNLETRNDSNAICAALYELFDCTLSETP